MHMKLALAQIENVSAQAARNLAQHHEMIAKAREQKADIVLFPEYSLGGSPRRQDAHALAVDAHHADILALAAHSKGLTSVVSGFEKAPDGALYNTAFVLRDGEVVARHRKLNIPHYGNLDEGDFFTAGEVLTTFPLGEGAGHHYTAGVMICADSWNPGLVYAQALRGCELLLQPVSSALNAVEGEYDNPAGWQINLAHTAMSWGTYVVMVNRVGEDQGMQFYGQSSMIDPYGRSLLTLGDQPELVCVEIDLAETAAARANLPTLRDASPAKVRALIDSVLGGN